MPDSEKIQSNPKTRDYFKNSWIMLKENYKAFIFTEIFAVFAFIAFLTLSALIVMIVVTLIPNFTLQELSELISERFQVSGPFRLYFVLGFLIILMGFVNCQFGLANDIMNSGEMYAEFRGSFNYFKNHWWQYFILTVLIQGIGGVLHGPFPLFRRDPLFSRTDFLNSIFFFILVQIIQIILYFTWFILTIHAFPSVTSKNSLQRSFKESYQILKHNPKTIFKTWGLYYLVFRLPVKIADILLVYIDFKNADMQIWQFLLGIPFLIEILIGFPLLSLITTGIYHNSPITKIKQIKQN